MLVNWKDAQQKAARTARWAVTMTKVRIRQVASRTRWQLVTFYGKSGAESVGVVDLLAIRKDHSEPVGAARRGDALQMVALFQVGVNRFDCRMADDPAMMSSTLRFCEPTRRRK